MLKWYTSAFKSSLHPPIESQIHSFILSPSNRCTICSWRAGERLPGPSSSNLLGFQWSGACSKEGIVSLHCQITSLLWILCCVNCFLLASTQLTDCWELQELNNKLKRSSKTTCSLFIVSIFKNMWHNTQDTEMRILMPKDFALLTAYWTSWYSDALGHLCLVSQSTHCFARHWCVVQHDTWFFIVPSSLFEGNFKIDNIFDNMCTIHNVVVYLNLRQHCTVSTWFGIPMWTGRINTRSYICIHSESKIEDII